MKKFVIIFLLYTVALFAQSNGNTGLAFLKYGFDARNIAMGDLGVVSKDYALSAYYNPALVTNFLHAQIMFSHSQLIQDVSSEIIAADFSLFQLPFIFSINTTTIPDIEVRTNPGEPLSTFNAHYFWGSISTGVHITNRLSAGLTIKYLYENIFSDEAYGFGFDFGLFYEDLIDNLNIGASLRNIGSMNQLREQKTKLPIDLRIGASYDFQASVINSDIFIQTGYQGYTETGDNHFHFGTEIFYNKVFAVRAGYMTGYESKGLTTGAGIVWGPLAFDYAFVPFDYGLGNTHTISVTYNFL
ncbi:MAG: hypothetical protein A2V66_09075 [Ignavibacteria bacterium RBG_13_36_8]|nr:MAG: hypothetical protein A2V66_09075 [Ignavibacteria bacterium RBG_13_36_8]